MKPILRSYGNFILINYLLNLFWEAAHESLYQDMPPFFRHLPYLAVAAVGDVAICLIVVFLVAVIYRRMDWFETLDRGKILWIISISAIASVVVEYVNVSMFQRWAYTTTMPLIPVIRVGLTPFFQITLLPFVSVFLAAYVSKPVMAEGRVEGDQR